MSITAAGPRQLCRNESRVAILEGTLRAKTCSIRSGPARRIRASRHSDAGCPADEDADAGVVQRGTASPGVLQGAQGGVQEQPLFGVDQGCIGG